MPLGYNITIPLRTPFPATSICQFYRVSFALSAPHLSGLPADIIGNQAYCGKEITVVALLSPSSSRYQRQMALCDFGREGQQRLKAAHILLVGAGGLGSAAALYLAGAGIGTLSLADDDHVSLTNLHRQVLYTEADIGKAKADTACQHLAERNNNICCQPLAIRLKDDALHNAVTTADLVLDCTDNLITRHALNACCIATATPWIHASVAHLRGQLTVFSPPFIHGCYRCLFPDTTPTAQGPLPILGPLPGIIGAMQALEAIRWIVSGNSPLIDTLTLFDGQRQRWHSLERTAQPHCPFCGTDS